MNLIIFGPQGSGKGTQADKLSEKYDLVHIETGQIFRDILREDTPLGRTVLEYNEKKEMVPDNITIDVLEHYLEKVPADKGVILDSAPRTMGQVAPIEEMMEKLGRSPDKAIYLTLHYDECIARIAKRYMCPICRRHFVLGKDIQSVNDTCPTCGGHVIQRSDDTSEGITKRLKIFSQVTMPVVEHYRKKGILVEIDGNQSAEKVFEDIVSKLQ